MRINAYIVLIVKEMRVIEKMIKLINDKKRTVSEKLFNKLCNNKGIVGGEILESTISGVKSPDLKIILNNTEIIVEVKELTGNKKEVEKLNTNIEKQLKELKVKQSYSGQLIAFHQATYVTSSKIIKRAFHDHVKLANKQLGSKEYEKSPGITIIYNNINFRHVNAFTYPVRLFDIDNFMYHIYATCPDTADKLITNDKNEVMGLTFEQDKKTAYFSPDRNDCKHISAVGLLSKINYDPEHTGLKLQLLHNIFAKKPLDINLLNTLACEQYKNTFDINDNSTSATLIRIDKDI